MVRLTLAALRRQRGLYALWVLSLALAVTGLVIIDVYRQSLADMIVRQGRNILTADVALTARRQLTGDERQSFRSSIGGEARFSETTEMMAMTVAGRESRLAQLRFVDDAYPLLGELRLPDRAVYGLDLAPTDVWVAADLLALLNVEVGSTLKIGSGEFVIRGVLKKDSSQTLRFGGFAPRIYLRAEALPKTGLLSFGSTFGTTVYATGLVPEKLDAKFRDPGVEVLTPKEIERGPLRILSNVLDYLGLIGLVTLSLGWVGVYYLGRRWLALERTGGALLKALGYSSRESRNLMLFKLGVILFAGVALGGVVSYVGARMAYPLLRDSLPEEFRLVWSWWSTLLLLVIGPLAGLLLLYAPLAAAANEKPLRLLHSTSAPARLSVAAFAWIAGSVLLLFSLLTLLQARSWRISGLFVSSMLAAVAFIAFVAWLGLRVLKSPAFARGGWRWHLVRAQWLRRPGIAVLLVVVSALSGLLAQLVPHLERTIVGDIRPPDRDDRPSLFVFDVQDEQLEPLRQLLAQNDLALSQTSPFIRSRLLKVNDQDFERRNTGTWSTREEEVEARFRNRGVNLTYRAGLSPSERIIAGETYATMKPGDVAVEVKYAERLGLALGDRLVFDVQGAEIPARVVSLRAIDWDSFQPNFFVQFRDPGELSEAPKTWILTVKRGALKPPEVQRLITAHFPNASSINVEETLDGVTDVVTKLSHGLKIASRLAMALGVFVVLMILLFQLASSGADSAQLRVQGVRARDLWILNLGVYGGLTVIGTTLGMVLALVANAAIATFGFQATPRWDGGSLVLIPLLTWALAAGGLTWLSVRQARGLLRDLRAL